MLCQFQTPRAVARTSFKSVGYGRAPVPGLRRRVTTTRVSAAPAQSPLCIWQKLVPTYAGLLAVTGSVAYLQREVVSVQHASMHA